MIRKRILFLGILLCTVGVVGSVATVLQKPKFKLTEAWMEGKAPIEVDGLQGIPAPRADQATYDTLQPFGMVTRDFRNSKEGFNVLLLAGDKRETFHSPNVCMPAQGILVTDEHVEHVPTRTRGSVPVAVAILRNAALPGEKQYMAFFYRVQDKFLARTGNSTVALTWAMFQGPLRGNFDQNTVFYRFITENANATKEELLTFVAHYLDAAHDSSGGFF